MDKANVEINGIPQGPFTITAVLSPNSPITHTGVLDEDKDINDGDIVVDIIAQDPYTGNTIYLNQVKYKQVFGSVVTGISNDEVFDLHCMVYSDLKIRDVSTMYVTSKPTTTTVQNKALPKAVKVKDSIDNFSDSAVPMCKKYNENMDAAQRKLGLVHERDDLQIFQGKENGSSPGLVVSQKDNKVIMFSGDGNQDISMQPGDGIVMNSSAIDTGSASLNNTTFQYGGLPQSNNSMNSVIPQGTITSPQPQTVPNIIKILDMVATVVNMMDLITACSDAVDEIRKL